MEPSQFEAEQQLEDTVNRDTFVSPTHFSSNHPGSRRTVDHTPSISAVVIPRCPRGPPRALTRAGAMRAGLCRCVLISSATFVIYSIDGGHWTTPVRFTGSSQQCSPDNVPPQQCIWSCFGRAVPTGSSPVKRYLRVGSSAAPPSSSVAAHCGTAKQRHRCFGRTAAVAQGKAVSLSLTSHLIEAAASQVPKRGEKTVKNQRKASERVVEGK